MKKLMMFSLLLILLLGTALYAQVDVSIGAGTSYNTTTGVPTPYGTYYKNFRQQYLYTAAELESAGGGAGNIYSLAFNVQNPNNCSPMPGFTIRIKETSQTVLTTTFETGTYTTVFSQDNFQPTAGWNIHTFSTPFYWNGSSNLLVDVFTTFIPGTYTQNASVYYSTTSAAMALRYQSDSEAAETATTGTTSTYRANIRFNMTAFQATNPPNATTLVAPADNATLIPVAGTTLSWNTATGAPAGYKLYFGTSPYATHMTDLGNVYSYNTGALQAGTTYYWQVVPYNAIGDAADCPVWSFSTIPAGVVSIGSGVVSTLNLPLNPFYGYNYSQNIYLQSEINVPDQRIEKINYYWNGLNTGNNSKHWTIYMAHTDLGAFASTTSWIPIAGFTEVFSGELSIPQAAGWIEITLTNPFIYNNSDNLVIAVLETTPGNDGSTAKFLGTSTTGINRGIRYQNDSVIPNPASPPTGTLVAGFANIMLQFGDLPAYPICTVSPESWDFPPTIINTGAIKQFAITNSGGGTLNIGSISVSGNYFSIEDNPVPLSLNSGETGYFKVKYLPTAAGEHNATVTIDYFVGGATIAISGECTDPTIYSLPYIQNFDSLTVPNFPNGWTVLNPDNPTITWKTESTSSYVLSAPNYAGIGYTSAAALNDWLITPPIALTAGVEYRIGYNYRAKGSTYTESLAFYSGNAPTAEAMTNNLATHAALTSNVYALQRVLFTPSVSGNYFFGWHATSIASQLGIAIDDIEIMVAPTLPVIHLSKNAMDFGGSYSGTPTSYQNLVVKNIGAGTLSLNASDVSLIGMDAGQFEIDATLFPLNLSADQSANIPVRFAPTTAGDKQATMRIVYGGNNYDVTLTGLAVASDALLESFEASTFPPAGWANPGIWSRSTSYKVHGTAAAYKYGGTSTQYVLSTPMLTVANGDLFKFWSLISTANGTLELVYSTDRTTWTALGAPISHPTTFIWQSNSFDLSSLAGGNYYFGIRTGLQAVGFYVDMVVGPTITPVVPGTPTLSAPANAATNQSIAPTLSWTAATDGGVVSSYNIYIGTSEEEMTVYGTSATNSFTVNPPLNWSTTYYWKVSGVNNAGEGVASAVRNFTTMADPTIYTLPWTEDFEGTTFPPANWARLTGLYPTETPATYAGGWASANFANVATPPNKSARLNIYSTSVKYWLATPPIAIPATGYELKFDLALTTYSGTNPVDPTQQLDDRFLVLISDSPAMANATVLREWNNSGSPYVYNDIATLGQNIGIDLSAYTGTKYIGFYGESTVAGGDNNVYVDNVTVREIPASPIFSYTPTEINFGTVMHNTPSVARSVIVSNNGGGAINLSTNDFGLFGDNAAEFSINPANLPASLGAGESVTIPITVTAQSVGALSANLRIHYNGDYYNVALSANALPAGIVIVGDGTVAQRPPFGTLWGYERSAALYTAAELGTIGFLDMVAWDCAATTTTQVPYKIYMGTTTDDAFTAQTFAALTANLSLVKQGTHVFNTSGWQQFALDSPFAYTGGNLIVAVETNYGGSGGGSGHTFRYTTSTAGSHMTWNTDSNPPTTSGALNASRPNLMLHLIEPIEGEPAAPTLIAPAHNATNMPIAGFNLIWGIDLQNGGVPDYYSVHLSMDEDAVFDDYYFETSNTFFNPVVDGEMELGYSESWYWIVQAWNSYGDAVAERAFKFTTEADPRILSLPFSENFDGIATGTTFPKAWTPIKSYSSSTLSISSSYSNTPSNSVYMYNYTTTETMRLVTPEIMVPMNSIKLSFQLRSTGTTNYSMKVGTVNSPDASGVFTEITTINPTVSAAFVQYVVSFANYTGTDRYIAFQHGVGATYQSFYLDTISLEELVANDLAITGFTGPMFGVAGNTVDFSVNVYNNGTAAQNAYTLQLINANTQAVLSSQYVNTALATEGTETKNISWTPSVSGSYNIQAKVILAGDVNAYNDLSAEHSLQIYPVGTFIPLVGNPATTTSSSSSPFNVYYKCSIAEAIYLQSEMQMASGTIHAIAYKNNFTQDLNKPVKIWMGHTTDNINNGWLDDADLTLVYDGTVHFPIGVNEVVITLDSPFQYTGGNLVVRTIRVMDTAYSASTNYFYYTADTVYPNRLRYVQSDTVNYDTDPLPAGSRNSNMPNISFFVTPYTQLPDPVAPVAELALVSNAPKLTWNAVPGAHTYVVYGSDDPYNWTNATVITTTGNLYYNVPTTVAKKFYRVAARSYGHQVRDWETILSPAFDSNFDIPSEKAEMKSHK